MCCQFVVSNKMFFVFFPNQVVEEEELTRLNLVFQVFTVMSATATLSSYSSSSSPQTIFSNRQWRLRLALSNPRFPNLSTTRTAATTTTTTMAISSSLDGRRRRRGSRTTRNPSSSSSDQKLEMVIDVEAVADRASRSLRRIVAESEAKFDGLVRSSKEALSDLRTLVVVDSDNRRVIISCRRSSMRFIASCLLWSVLIVVVGRFVVGLGVSWGFGGGYRGFWIRKRDRSLGGREVVVGRMRRRTRDFDFKAPTVNPLSPVRGVMVASRDEEMTALQSRKRVVSTEKKLPKWWPDLVSYYSSAPSAANQEQQREAQRVIRAILDNRMSGKDFTEDDIIQFRQVCKKSGARVNIETTNARDSFYRASVDFVLNSCSSSGIHSMELQLDGEDPRQFIAGLAENIGLESIHASRIVSAAVAARTRSYFLQAWALEMQQKRDEALMELSKICLIHKIFPPEESSPEIEMVARGLERHLRLEQREQLLNLLLGTCDAESSRSAAEALGLAHTDLLR